MKRCKHDSCFYSEVYFYSLQLQNIFNFRIHRSERWFSDHVLCKNTYITLLISFYLQNLINYTFFISSFSFSFSFKKKIISGIILDLIIFSSFNFYFLFYVHSTFYISFQVHTFYADCKINHFTCTILSLTLTQIENFLKK